MKSLQQLRVIGVTRVVIDVFGDVLNEPGLSADANLFECGADSLQAMDCATSLEAKYQVALGLEMFLDYTAGEIAGYIVKHHRGGVLRQISDCWRGLEWGERRRATCS